MERVLLYFAIMCLVLFVPEDVSIASPGSGGGSGGTGSLRSSQGGGHSLADPGDAGGSHGGSIGGDEGEAGDTSHWPPVDQNGEPIDGPVTRRVYGDHETVVLPAIHGGSGGDGDPGSDGGPFGGGGGGGGTYGHSWNIVCGADCNVKATGGNGGGGGDGGDGGCGWQCGGDAGQNGGGGAGGMVWLHLGENTLYLILGGSGGSNGQLGAPGVGKSGPSGQQGEDGEDAVPIDEDPDQQWIPQEGLAIPTGGPAASGSSAQNGVQGAPC